MKIYFAGSIRGGRDDQQLYAVLIERLKTFGTVLTEHIGNAALLKQGETHLSDEAIFARDLALLEECDAIVAEVTSPSLGVGYELGRMEGRKPILCLFREGEGRHLSAMLAGNPRLRVADYHEPADLDLILADFLR